MLQLVQASAARPSLAERIAVDPVQLILDLLAAGQSESDLLANYPGLLREDILACLHEI
jgi:uncharacterized protein (DUF433 family)